MGAKRYVLAGSLLLLAGIQFVRPDRNTSTLSPGREDFLEYFSAPPAVRQSFKTACYDCHSDNTRYPWYSNVQPVGWWLQRHVNTGKRELNFSRFGSYAEKRRKQRLEEILDEVLFKTMPLKPYTWMHRDAVFEESEREALIDWLDEAIEGLESGDGSSSE